MQSLADELVEEGKGYKGRAILNPHLNVNIL